MNLFLIDLFQYLSRHETGPFSPVFNCQQDQRLAFGPASSFAGALTVKISGIHFDQSLRRIVLISISHRGSELSLHPMCTVNANADHLTQTGSRNTTLVNTHQVDGNKSFREQQFGLVKNSASGSVDLIFATGIFMIQFEFNTRLHGGTSYHLSSQFSSNNPPNLSLESGSSYGFDGLFDK